MQHNYGIQLFSVRDSMAKSVPDTLKKIAELGYKYVEFAGFFGHSAADIKAMLDEYGLICSGTHSGWEEIRPTTIMDTIRYHKTINNPNFIVPGLDLSSLDKIDAFCKVLTFAKPILEAEGIRLGYHNHSHEFVVMPWGSTIHSELERRTDVEFEIDTFWVYNAGLDPVTVLEKLKDRVRVIHVKDGIKDVVGKPLGMGEAPVKAVVDYAKKNGLTMVVESETQTPSGLEEARICIEYLKSLEA
ncbi:MAG: sugar phosphate isomerase/epimerase [Clostridia bacterium]|nr:sugar phosphate isomerase/epimerase [Clostridia bacterium]